MSRAFVKLFITVYWCQRPYRAEWLIIHYYETFYPANTIHKPWRISKCYHYTPIVLSEWNFSGWLISYNNTMFFFMYAHIPDWGIVVLLNHCLGPTQKILPAFCFPIFLLLKFCRGVPYIINIKEITFLCISVFFFCPRPWVHYWSTIPYMVMIHYLCIILEAS